MARTFIGIRQLPYIGTPYATAVTLGDRMGVAVALQFPWLAYNASSLNTNINVRVDLSAARVAQQLKKIRSIFIDNMGSDTPIYVNFPSTGYSVVAKPNSTGWFPVYTSDFIIQVVGLGFASGDIPTTTMLVSNLITIPSIDEEFGQAISLERSSPVIIFGGGAPLLSASVILAGQSYTSGALAVSGGGGSGATAHGTLDGFGRFTGVVIDLPGTGYIGPPTITATASHAARAAWAGITTGYGVGTIVSSGGTEWVLAGAFGGIAGAPTWNSGTLYNVGNYVTSPNTGHQYLAVLQQSNLAPETHPSAWTDLGPPGPPGSSSGNFTWNNSGTPGGTTATFSPVLGAPLAASAIFSPGFAAPALGDQCADFLDTIVATGVFRNNLFGSPYNSGTLTITDVSINLVTWAGTGVDTWKLDASDGSLIFNFGIGLFTAAGFTNILDRHGMNVKLDATKTYRLNMTALATTSLTLIHSINYTFNPNGF